MTIAAFTGHRKLQSPTWTLTALNSVTERLRDDFGVSTGLCGMAWGADLLWGKAAIQTGFELRAYVPFPDQDSRWRKNDKETRQQLLEHCSIVKTFSPTFDMNAYGKRDRAMVDDSDFLVAAIDFTREKTSGTLTTLKYARKNGRPVIIVDLDKQKIVFPEKTLF